MKPLPDLNYQHLLMGRYLEWKGMDTGHVVSMARYARTVLLCSPSTVYKWLRGDRPIPSTVKRFLLQPSRSAHARQQPRRRPRSV